MRVIIVIALLLGTMAGHSQTFEESMRTSFGKSPRPEFKFYSRNSFVTSSFVRMFGLKAGLRFNKTISFGIGYNLLNSHYEVALPELSGMDPNKGVLEFNYGSIYTEYTFHSTKRWEFNIPVQFGAGPSRYKLKGTEQRVKEGWNVLYEPAIIANFRLFRYMSIGAGTGYRLMIWKNAEISERLTAPQYIVRLKIHFDDIYNDVTGNGTNE